MITPVIVQLQWDGWTDRLIMPPDYLRLSTQERRLITLEELRSWTPKEMRHVPDWGIARLFAATMLPGFNPSRCISGVGAGFRVYSRIFLADTALSPWKVPDDWNNDDNLVECLGPGATGSNGVGGSLPKGGNGGNGGGGGCYAAKRNIVFAKDGTGAFPTISTKVGGVGQDTWFNDVTTVLAKAAPARLGGNTALCIGDVITGGGDGGNGGDGGISTGTSSQFFHGGGGAGGAGGGGCGGPDGVGAKGFNGGNGGPGGGGGGGGNGAGGDGGAPGGGNGPAGNGVNGGNGTTWEAGRGTGGGGAGGNGGKGAANLNANAAGGSSAGRGGFYGGGGGGGGGGGSAQTPNTPGGGGGRDVGTQGLIVITNNAGIAP